MTEAPRAIGRPSSLTEEVTVQICAAIRAGVYAHVAAQAAGIGPSTFTAWMRRGEDETDERHFQFRQRVLQARAQARMSAEIIVKRDEPLQWLKHVARDRKGDPGWTTVEKHESTSIQLQASVVIDAQKALQSLSDEELAIYERVTERIRDAQQRQLPSGESPEEP